METYTDHSHPAQKTPTSSVGASTTYEAEEFSLVDLMIVMAKRKRLLILAPLIAAVMAVGVSLILPDVYTATVRLLPPQQAQSGAAALLSQLGGAGALAGIAAVKSPGELYIGILKSRTIADRIIARFDLKKSYGLESLEQTRGRLAVSTLFVSGKDGLIVISVDHTNQKLVASLANAYVTELQLLTKTLAVTEASQRRLFFERQLEMTKDNLAKVEIALKGAMSSGGVISVDSEGQAILATTATLKAQVSAKEIQLGSMRAFVTNENPEYKRASQELISLRAELAKLEGGRANSGSAVTSKAGLDNIQLMRDLKYHQMLYELLAKQYEAARLDEAKDSSLIQVLDPALEPEFKSKPKRALIVIAATLVAFFAALAWALFAAARQRAIALPERAARWEELRSSLRFK